MTDGEQAKGRGSSAANLAAPGDKREKMLVGEFGDGVRGMSILSRELRWDDPDGSASQQSEPDIQSEPEAGGEDEARNGPGARPGDPTSTALSVVERAGGSGASTANELLRAV